MNLSSFNDEITISLYALLFQSNYMNNAFNPFSAGDSSDLLLSFNDEITIMHIDCVVIAIL